MGLKQAIVIKNEYSIKGADGKGSRGSSIGRYINRYMNREDAVEPTTPIVGPNVSDFLERYMLRTEASDNASSPTDVAPKNRKIDGKGGISFSHDEVSLSDRKVRYMSRRLQAGFDEGKTALKTVLSFDHSFLVENGIVPRDFECNQPGDYKGMVDQLRLRMAIKNGLQAFAKDYDALEYVGTIQVDTTNLHCHLLMMDMGNGRITKDGTQQGKIHERSKRKIRRGISLYLRQHQHIPFLSLNYDIDKQNTMTNLKKVTHRILHEHGGLQFLTTCLPANKRLWRAGSNDRRMKKANTLLGMYVDQIFHHPDSGYDKVYRNMREYVSHRQVKEQLSNQECDVLLESMDTRMKTDAMNAVYTLLKKQKDSTYCIQTPLLEYMSMDYSQLVTSGRGSELGEFAFRLRTYGSRKEYHRNEAIYAQDMVDMLSVGDRSSAGTSVISYFENEMRYHEQVLSKYQHMMPVQTNLRTHRESYKKIKTMRESRDNLKNMLQDRSMLQMNQVSASLHGKEKYNRDDGEYMVLGVDVLNIRYRELESKYFETYNEFLRDLRNDGCQVIDDQVALKPQHDFNDVRALDMHHLRYDFTKDIVVSDTNVNSFIQVAKVRQAMYQQAVQYLEMTNQSQHIGALHGQDIGDMVAYANTFATTHVLKSEVPDVVNYPRQKGVSLDHTLDDDAEYYIQNIIEHGFGMLDDD